MALDSLYVLVLAAGKGTRMKSAHPKVMHAIGGSPMLGHVLRLADELGADGVGVVVGPEGEGVAALAKTFRPDAEIFVQNERLGTAHAVLTARDVLSGRGGKVLVLYGDTPLLTKASLDSLVYELDAGADVGVLGFEAADPHGYGRLVLDDEGLLSRIVEEKDASAEEREIDFCNSGVMGFRAEHMLMLLDEISNENAKGEYYLTDAVAGARARGLKAIAAMADEIEVLGVNDRIQLAEAEHIFQCRMREAAALGGTSMTAPETVYFSHDTRIGADVLIEPHVVFGPGVVVHDGAVIYGFSHLEGAVIGKGAKVGPYARLRPGAEIGEGAKVGNFVEIKMADVKAGAKVNHLSYIGDSEVGSGANIGAGTITCNYDGYFKHKTIIGENSFVGSNSSLIAPVCIGDGAYIGSGSVISADVPEDALAVARPQRRVLAGWAAKYRQMQAEKKQKKTDG